MSRSPPDSFALLPAKVVLPSIVTSQEIPISIAPARTEVAREECGCHPAGAALLSAQRGVT